MGTGYTRADTADNIANGNVIDADDLDAEFNAIESSFSSSTGHTHDGTSAEGGPITVIGPTQDVVATATELSPKTTNVVDLGTTSLQYKNVYIDGIGYIDSIETDSFTLGGVAVTSTAAELNILDGVTVTTTEINYLDGVTSNIQTQLNSTVSSLADLGVTASLAEVNLLDGVTATTAELNYVDGVTSSIQTQIDTKAPIASPSFSGTVSAPTLNVTTNFQIGNVSVTSSAAELNLLDGVTATTAELNYVDGVTSNIQTQINAKASLSGATFTGDVDFGANKITYANMYSTEGDLPSAATYHGMFAHVHGTGKAYFSHASAWYKLINEDANGDVSVPEEFTAKSYNTTYATLSGTTPAVNCESGNMFSLTTSGNTTFTFSNPPATGTAYAFILKLTAGGIHTITYPTSVRWPSGVAPTVPASGETSTIYLYAPVVRGRKGEYKKEILNYKKRGFRKIKIDETLYDIENVPELNKKVKHDISILVDRIVLNSSLGNRLAEGIETAVNLANGLIFVEYEDETLPKKFRKIEKLIFSTKFACPESGFTIEEIEPRLFSFNSPFGACEECEGIGVKLNVDPNLVIPNEKKVLQMVQLNLGPRLQLYTMHKL